MALRVFVSHSHKDAAWCDPFVDALAGHGFDIWYDRKGLYAGAQWVRTIEDELAKCDVFLIILTPDSWASDWVRKEELALALYSKKRIIGIMMKPTEVSGFIAVRQMIEVVGQPAVNAARTVAASLGAQPSQASAPLKPAAQSSPLPDTATVRSSARSTDVYFDLTGKWVELDDPYPWVLALEQMGNTVTGNVSVGTTPPDLRAKAKDNKVKGTIAEAGILLEFENSLYWAFRLRRVDGRLVGTKSWRQYVSGPDHEAPITLVRQ